MKRRIIAITILLFFLAVIAANAKNPDAASFVYPAEFETHESIWLAWPKSEYAQGRPTEKVILSMIKALAPHVAVDLMVQNQQEQDQVQRIFTLLNIPSDHVRFRHIPHGDIWLRDMGPIFLKNSKNEMIIADFGFNFWGYDTQVSSYTMEEEPVDRLVARELDLSVIRSSIISEGGNREFNGKGTMMVTEAVELQRNPGWTKEELEAEYKRIFHVDKVIWLAKGLAEDPLAFKGKLPGNVFSSFTTGGHIDEYARFVGPKTILLVEVRPEERDSDPLAKITYENMEENCQILKNATDQDGKPFTVIRAPHVEPLYEKLDANDLMFNYLREMPFEDGTVIAEEETVTMILAASYMNYVVTNGVVLIPIYWQEGRSEKVRKKDEAFKRIIEQVFPGRQIVQINPENVNLGGGGMHCISQQMPAR